METAAAAQAAFIWLQALIVPLLLLNWARVASGTPSFAWVVRPLAVAALPLAELCFLLGVVAVLFGAVFHALAGPRLAAWARFDATLATMAENAFVGARPRAAPA